MTVRKITDDMVMLPRRRFLAGTAAFLVSGCGLLSANELDLPEPVQIDRTPWPVAAGMMGLATLSAKVLVLSRRDYPTTPADTLSAVSPLDLAVAWGLAARSDVRKAVQLTQSDRRYNWRSRKSDAGMSGVRNFTRYSGNWHVVPATPDVAQALSRIAVGDVVRIEGDLVQVTFTNGTYYRSSMTRDDTGDGACEVVRVRSVEIDRRSE